jgi:RNA polymerase sigma-70 factor (ECF subfamily)
VATDKELVEQIRLGDQEAYSILFHKYYLQIYNICLSMLKNSHEAEELAQEMFIHAYFKLDQLRDPEKFLPWLKKIAQNRSKNYVQRIEAKETTLNLER